MRSLFLLFVVNLLSAGLILPVQARQVLNTASSEHDDVQALPATTVAEWFAQVEATLAQVTAVRLEQSTAGLQVILETDAELATPITRVVGNALIADIANARLSQEFQQSEPIAGIALVSVTQLPGDRIRVAITGTTAPPVTQVSPVANGLALTVSPGAATATGEPEAIELVVTGEQESGYTAPNASVGTLTDTPLRDIPQAIQVIPQQVLQDQGETNLSDALRNATSVAPGTFGQFTIRGFGATVLSDGNTAPQFNFQPIVGLNNVEQIEILRGPASVLYGSGAPGGTVNVTTEQPLREPRYEISGTIGAFNYYSPTIDLTGPLNSSGTITYRLNVAYENTDSFIDFIRGDQLAVFPVLRLELGEDTTLSLQGKYFENAFRGSFDGIYALIPASGTVFPNPNGEIPRSRNFGEPDFDIITNLEWNIGYLLEHQFNDDWSLRNRFRVNVQETDSLTANIYSLEADNRTILRDVLDLSVRNESYNLQTDVIGNFQTGSITHEVLVGLELERTTFKEQSFGDEDVPPLDAFNPVYGRITRSNITLEPVFDVFDTSHTIGIYAQNLVSINDQLKILLGGRFDWLFYNNENRRDNSSNYTEETALTPRIGIVYQPIEALSLYGSWSRSFEPQFGRDRQGNPYVPITGDQFEVGVKADLFDGDVSALLAAYQITRQNDFQPDPLNPDFSIQIGEQRSRGIELNVTGEPLAGLRLIAGYAYTDAEITEDTTGLEGNRSAGIPQHSANLWAVYEIQRGDLEGLGFGAGVFYIGDRPGDPENTFDISGRLLTNALIYYQRDNWRVQFNVENLFDVEYFNGTGSFVNAGAPFTIRGTVSVTF